MTGANLTLRKLREEHQGRTPEQVSRSNSVGFIFACMIIGCVALSFVVPFVAAFVTWVLQG